MMGDFIFRLPPPPFMLPHLNEGPRSIEHYPDVKPSKTFKSYIREGCFETRGGGAVFFRQGE